MSDIAEVIEFEEGVKARIIWDSDQISDMYDPRQLENIGTMLCGHHNYILGDEQLKRGEDVSYRIIEDEGVGAVCMNCGKEVLADDWFTYFHSEDQDKDEWEPEDYECGGKPIRPRLVGVYALPLFLFDHSGISMSASSARFEMQDSAGWDWGCVGVIYVTEAKMKEEYKPESEWFKEHHGGKSLSEFAYDILRSETETYDLYLTGQCFGYEIVGEDDESLDSCWGFLGEESVTEEATTSAKYYVQQARSRRAGNGLPIQQIDGE